MLLHAHLRPLSAGTLLADDRTEHVLPQACLRTALFAHTGNCTSDSHWGNSSPLCQAVLQLHHGHNLQESWHPVLGVWMHHGVRIADMHQARAGAVREDAGGQHYCLAGDTVHGIVGMRNRLRDVSQVQSEFTHERF